MLQGPLPRAETELGWDCFLLATQEPKCGGASEPLSIAPCDLPRASRAEGVMDKGCLDLPCMLLHPFVCLSRGVHMVGRASPSVSLGGLGQGEMVAMGATPT